jgi:tetratricopeptide (TPR) repeat protein
MPAPLPAPAPQSFLSGRWGTAAAVLVLVLAALASYANGLDGELVFDDIPSIRLNRTIDHLWPPDSVLFPPRDRTVAGRPLVNLSLAVNFALHGTQVRGYHLFNLAVHVLAALTLFGLVRRTLQSPGIPDRARQSATGLALAAALLWAVHPLQTESVTYIIQRAEALVGLFYLLTLYCVVRGAGSGRPAGWYVAAVAACLLGMASKEVMVTAPVVVLLYDRVFLAGSFAAALRRRAGLYAGLAATWGLLLALLSASGGRAGSAGLAHGITPWAYAQMQCGWILHYLRLCFWPSPLVFDYGPTRPTAEADWMAVVGIAVLAAAVLVALVRFPRLGFLGICFFALLAPTSSFVPIATQVAAEHRMYLPLAAVLVAVVVSVHAAWARLAGPGPPRFLRRAVLPTAVVLAVALLGWQTQRRNDDYRSDLALWKDTAAKRPDNPRGHLNLAAAHFNRGDATAALAELDVTVRLAPEDADAWCNRGQAKQRLGRHDEAIADLTRAIELRPDQARYYLERGRARRGAGRLDEAVEDFTRSLSLEPDQAETYFYRGNALLALGRTERAIADYTRATELQADFAQAYGNRGAAYGQQGKLDEAIRDCTRAIDLRPNGAEAYKNRALFYFRGNQPGRAWNDLRMAASHGAALDPQLVRQVQEALRQSPGQR